MTMNEKKRKEIKRRYFQNQLGIAPRRWTDWLEYALGGFLAVVGMVAGVVATIAFLTPILLLA